MMLTWLDIAIVAGYFIISFGLGIYYTKFIKTDKDFFLAGKSMPWWVATCSLAATDIGTETYIGVTAIVAASGLVWVNYDWIPGAIIPSIIAAWIFVGYYWRSGVTTLPEFLERRYGPSMRVLWSLLFVIVRTLTLGVIIYTLAIPLSAIIGWPFWLSLVIAIGISALYSILGGLVSVMLTDVLQFIVMTVCAFGVIFFSLEAVGGWGNLVSSLDSTMFHIVRTYGNGSPDTWWGAMFIGLLSLSLPYWCTDQNMVQKCFACKSEKEAKMAMGAAGIFKMPMTFVWGLAGLCCAVLFPQLISTNPDEAMPTLIQTVLPPGAIGIAITALYAAGISSCDGLLNAMSAVITSDIYKRFVKSGATDKHYLWVGRVTSAVLLVFASLFAMVVFPLFGTAYTAWQTVLSYAQFPLFVTLAIAIFYKRATAAPAFIGLVLGSLVAFVMNTYIGPSIEWWSFVWAGWVGGAVTLVVTIIGSLFTKPYSDEKLKGLCWGTTEKPKEEKVKKGLFGTMANSWRIWAGISLFAGIFFTIYFSLI